MFTILEKILSRHYCLHFMDASLKAQRLGGGTRGAGTTQTRLPLPTEPSLFHCILEVNV